MECSLLVTLPARGERAVHRSRTRHGPTLRPSERTAPTVALDQMDASAKAPIWSTDPVEISVGALARRWGWRAVGLSVTGIGLYVVAPSLLTMFGAWPRLAGVAVRWFVVLALLELCSFAALWWQESRWPRTPMTRKGSTATGHRPAWAGARPRPRSWQETQRARSCPVVPPRAVWFRPRSSSAPVSPPAPSRRASPRSTCSAPRSYCSCRS